MFLHVHNHIYILAFLQFHTMNIFICHWDRNMCTYVCLLSFTGDLNSVEFYITLLPGEEVNIYHYYSTHVISVQTIFKIIMGKIHTETRLKGL